MNTIDDSTKSIDNQVTLACFLFTNVNRKQAKVQLPKDNYI